MLERDKSGKLKVTVRNVMTILEKHPKLKGALKFDDFNKRAYVTRDTQVLPLFDGKPVQHVGEPKHDVPIRLCSGRAKQIPLATG